MCRLLGGIENVICHMDDILVHGKDAKSHDKTLKLVLSRLEEAELTLTEEKCEIGQAQVKFLGHIIDAKGVSTDPDKVVSIRDFPWPTCKTELRRLNGMLNQLDKFIPHLSEITAPMRELLKESKAWTWSQPQAEAFQKVKQTLMSAQVIAHYDPKLKTIVATDANNSGLEAAMLQIQKDGTRWPIYYASRSLTAVEQNYAAIEKEALATAWACNKLDQFLR